ncbi:hypothetical protein CRG98_014358 [Punica granatum]|uniref:C2H2-type domain-containing protein n=1 Tax=Punica granatum TaxID=22663 RepID=A0A2I0K9I7_PUNGR|nr:hypothetical protein CRG98_014358 [Punica granatum]
MAAFGWNSRRPPLPVPGINHARPSLQHGQIVCSLCGLTFVNPQCLIKHVESHIHDKERISRTRNELSIFPVMRDAIPKPSPPGFLFPVLPPSQPALHGGFPMMAIRGRNPNFFNGNHIALPPPNPPPQVLAPISRGNHVFRPQFIMPMNRPRINTMDEPPSDCTRPFLQLIEFSIATTVKPGDPKNEIASGKIDLELKLY